MNKRFLCLLLVLSMLAALMIGCSQNGSGQAKTETSAIDKTATEKPTEDKKAESFELEVVATNPEYEAQEAEVWAMYEKENPNIKISLISVNETNRNAFSARVSAGDPPNIESSTQIIDKNNYKLYSDLSKINYPYWDKINVDSKSLFKQETGIDYVPCLDLYGARDFTFVYYEDEMEKAGLNPKESVRSMEDLDKFLADAKAYLDKTGRADYVVDIGWHTLIISEYLTSLFSVAINGDLQSMRDLFMGKIRWDDLEKNPLVPVMEKWQEYTQKGYLPAHWPLRDWESEYEAGFIAKKSIMALHGPWIWAKVEAANPSAKLNGFPIPPKNGNNKVAATPVSGTIHGMALYSKFEGTPVFDEMVKAFNWVNSPEIVKLKADILGCYPPMDFSDVGGYDMAHPQYQNVIKPLLNGEFGKWEHLLEPFGKSVASRFKVDGMPDVLNDSSMATVFDKYLSGEMSLKEFMDMCQKRWDDGYKITN